MIQRLNIRNYAIIEKLDIDFSDQLTIITGETGAGKSIMLGALGLIMGQRADLRALYNQENKCIIEGHFEVGAYDLKAFFEGHDIDYDHEVIVRREITPSGKSRAFVNDTPVRLDVLKKLSENLVDLHQQFDTLDIHDVGFQYRVIDALAGNQDLLKRFRALFREYSQTKQELSQLKKQSAQAGQENDFLRFQLSELKEAELTEDEQVVGEREMAVLNNAEDVKRKLATAFLQLSDSENAVLSQLETINMDIQTIAEYHEKLPGLAEKYQGIIFELQELASEFERIADQTEYDGEKILELENRLNLIYKLENKHQVSTVAELLAIQANLEERLKEFTDVAGNIEQLEKDLLIQEDKLRKLGERLSKKRKSVVPAFLKRVHAMLEELSMEHAQIQVKIEHSDSILSTGTDELVFLFAPNKGSRFEEIKGIASGGELSRLTLVIKSLVASSIPLPTLIFDEIDSGVSGDVALKMGAILKKLSDEHQVVCITHSPQVAAKAHRHYFVYKSTTKDRTLTNVKLLDKDERILEIAKMLSGNPPSAFAKENAKELLG